RPPTCAPSGPAASRGCGPCRTARTASPSRSPEPVGRTPGIFVPTLGGVSVGETLIRRVPEPFRSFALKHRELVKFAVVGGTCFVIDTVIFLALKTTILATHPVTAKIIATLIATIVSYILNREWSFRTRGGRERPHEAALFFLVSGVGV